MTTAYLEGDGVNQSPLTEPDDFYEKLKAALLMSISKSMVTRWHRVPVFRQDIILEASPGRRVVDRDQAEPDGSEYCMDESCQSILSRRDSLVRRWKESHELRRERCWIENVARHAERRKAGDAYTFYVIYTTLSRTCDFNRTKHHLFSATTLLSPHFFISYFPWHAGRDHILQTAQTKG